MLLELAKYLETDIEARSAVTSALIYPAVVAMMAVVDRRRTGGLRVAQVQNVLLVAEREASAATRMLLSISGFIS